MFGGRRSAVQALGFKRREMERFRSSNKQAACTSCRRGVVASTTCLGLPTRRDPPSLHGRQLQLQLAQAASEASSAPSKCPMSKATSLFTNPSAATAAAGTSGARAGGALSPLGQAGGAECATPALWLSAGVSGQDVPGRLVPGLRKLDDLGEFLLELPSELEHELGLKRRAFDDPQRRPEVFVAEPQSLAAQEECLELFLDYLPRRYPQLYAVEGAGEQRTVTVKATGEVHRVSDFAASPLELCARIVQEDLILMRTEEAPSTQAGGAPSKSPAQLQHVMSAAAVVFSFANIQEKLSEALLFIHRPVPGFEAELLSLLNRTFASIRPGHPLWRNNWGLSDTGILDKPLYGQAAEFAHKPTSQLKPEQLWLKTEYQTLRRLPASGSILFTVRTMVEPLSAMSSGGPEAAAAAATLASSVRGMSPAMRVYKGLATAGATEAVLDYLSRCQQQAPVHA